MAPDRTLTASGESPIKSTSRTGRWWLSGTLVANQAHARSTIPYGISASARRARDSIAGEGDTPTLLRWPQWPLSRRLGHELRGGGGGESSKPHDGAAWSWGTIAKRVCYYCKL